MDLVACTLMHVGALSRRDIRVAIHGLEQAIKAMPNTGEIGDCPVQNIFAPGTYCREITMPEGLVITGRIHKHEHTNIISKGRCVVLTEFGFEEIVAPAVFKSAVGTKRVVYTLEDTVWTTVHANPTNETDVDKLLADLSTDCYSDIEIEVTT